MLLGYTVNQNNAFFPKTRQMNLFSRVHGSIFKVKHQCNTGAHDNFGIWQFLGQGYKDFSQFCSEFDISAESRDEKK